MYNQALPNGYMKRSTAIACHDCMHSSMGIEEYENSTRYKCLEHLKKMEKKPSTWPK